MLPKRFARQVLHSGRISPRFNSSSISAKTASNFPLSASLEICLSHASERKWSNHAEKRDNCSWPNLATSCLICSTLMEARIARGCRYRKRGLGGGLLSRRHGEHRELSSAYRRLTLTSSPATAAPPRSAIRQGMRVPVGPRRSGYCCPAIGPCLNHVPASAHLHAPRAAMPRDRRRHEMDCGRGFSA